MIRGGNHNKESDVQSRLESTVRDSSAHCQVWVEVPKTPGPVYGEKAFWGAVPPTESEKVVMCRSSSRHSHVAQQGWKAPGWVPRVSVREGRHGGPGESGGQQAGTRKEKVM